MDDSKKLYQLAYDLHYKKRKYSEAYRIYKSIIEDFPTEDERKYADSQIANIESMPGFKKIEDGNIHVPTIAYNSEKEIKEKILFTSGYNFDGYTVAEYIKFISSEIVLGMGIFRAFSASISNLMGMESNALTDKLTEAKEIVYMDIRNQAHQLGANAIIGVDLDYTMFGGELIGVIMSGTAVRIFEIQKIDIPSKSI